MVSYRHRQEPFKYKDSKAGKIKSLPARPLESQRQTRSITRHRSDLAWSGKRKEMWAEVESKVALAGESK
ncbi:MAG: hypothetical protein LUH42_02195, partial [Oscillospiraceae bacterium]|nr:hypothetical protein [Oscillospiraceae bacterium]